MIGQLLLTATLMSCAPATEPPLPATVSLAGPRRVEAVIDHSGEDWVVKVRMLPIRTFDVATNTKLNREKARHFALQALAKLLVKDRSSVLEYSEAQVKDTQTKDGLFTLTLRVPVAQLKVRSPTAPSDADGKLQVAYSSGLFTCKSDFSRTLVLIAELFTREADSLPVAHDDQVFSTALADLEAKGIDAFQALSKDIRNEKLLLQIEQDELLVAVKENQSQFIDTLKTTLSKHKAQSLFRDLSIDKPFDGFLLSNLLLMETTGAKIIQLPGKKKVVFAVASTVLRDDSASERLRAERVCRVKALASVVGEQQGVKVYRLEKDEERTQITIEKGKETSRSVSDFLQITQTKVEGISKALPVIGRWRSREGNVYYLAIGMIVDATGLPVSP